MEYTLLDSREIGRAYHSSQILILHDFDTNELFLASSNIVCLKIQGIWAVLCRLTCSITYSVPAYHWYLVLYISALVVFADLQIEWSELKKFYQLKLSIQETLRIEENAFRYSKIQPRSEKLSYSKSSLCFIRVISTSFLKQYLFPKNSCHDDRMWVSNISLPCGIDKQPTIFWRDILIICSKPKLY